jgi:hypothetical protein
MKLALALLLAATTLCLAQSRSLVTARTVYHTDRTFTESVQDPVMRTQTEHTYAARESELAPKVLVSKKVYMLNERLEPVHGNIYDGRDQLMARVLFLFDVSGQRTEQRMMNLQNQVYQVIRFSYDANGKPLPPRSQTFNVEAPNFRPATVDLTQRDEGPATLDRSQGEFRGNVQQLPGATGADGPIRVGADGMPIGQPQQGTETKKKSFWNRLGFGKKE